jgi:hypothetical protein
MAENPNPISRIDIRATLEALNAHRKRKSSPLFSINDQVIEDIYDALEEYRQIIDTDAFFSDRGNRIERLNKILDTGKDFLKALRASKQNGDLAIFHTDIPEKLKFFISSVMKSASYMSNLEVEIEKKDGRRPMIGRTIFISRMFNTYTKATGRRPGLSSKSTGGPFLSFISAFLPEESEGALIPAIRKTINKNVPK